MKKLLTLALLVPLACVATHVEKKEKLIKKAIAVVDENRCPICGYGKPEPTQPVHIPKGDTITETQTDSMTPKCACGKPNGQAKPKPGRQNSSDDKSDRCAICSLTKPSQDSQDEEVTETQAAETAVPKCACGKPNGQVKPKPGRRNGSEDSDQEDSSDTDDYSNITSDDDSQGAACPLLADDSQKDISDSDDNN